MSLSGLQGLWSGGLLLINGYAIEIIVILVLVAALSGSGLVAGGTTETTELEPVGELSLSIDPQSVSPGSSDEVAIPVDGVVPISTVETLNLTASYHQHESARSTSNSSVEIETTLKRETREGTLWAVTTPMAQDSGTGALEVTQPVDVAAALTHARRQDASIGTDSGSVVIEMQATITPHDTSQYPASATIDIRPRGDHLRFTPESNEYVYVETTKTLSPSPWSTIITSASVALVLGIVTARKVGRLPLNESSHRRHRIRWIRWRYRRHLVESAEPIDVQQGIRLGGPGAVVAMGRQCRRPIRIDSAGVMGVTVDAETYLWSPTPSIEEP